MFDPASSPAAGTSTDLILEPNTLEQLLALDDGNTGLLREMIQLFRDDTPPRITLLETLLQENDPVELANTAHAVKGAASTMGVTKMRFSAQGIESLGRTGGDLTQAHTLLAELKLQFQEALQALDEFVAKCENEA